MLTGPLAHTGQPLAPHDVWAAWNLDPVLLAVLGAALVVHRRGRVGPGRASDVWRTRAFVVAVVVVGVAVLSPLDALSGALASAHMGQHVLLMLVAAPLLAFSAPSSTLLRGAPTVVRRLPARLRRHLAPARGLADALWHPATALLLYVGTLWIWHAARLYDAALASEPIHALQHATFLLAAVLFWRVVLSGRRGQRVPGGLGFLLVWAAAMGSVLLALLMTFATEPWYAAYATTTQAWGLDHLEDQQLAGALMWVPAGAIHVVVALALFASWLTGDPSEHGRRRRSHQLETSAWVSTRTRSTSREHEP